MVDILKLAVLSLGFVVVIVGTGCDEHDGSADCSLDNVLDNAETSGTVDCGSLALDASDADFEAMSRCVADAASGELSFRAIWELEGIDSELSEAYLGRLDDGHFEIVFYHYDSDVSGVGEAVPQAFGRQCLTFAPVPEPCGSLRENLCFACGAGPLVEQCP